MTRKEYCEEFDLDTKQDDLSFINKGEEFRYIQTFLFTNGTNLVLETLPEKSVVFFDEVPLKKSQNNWSGIENDRKGEIEAIISFQPLTHFQSSYNKPVGITLPKGASEIHLTRAFRTSFKLFKAIKSFEYLRVQMLKVGQNETDHSQLIRFDLNFIHKILYHSFCFVQWPRSCCVLL